MDELGRKSRSNSLFGIRARLGLDVRSAREGSAEATDGRQRSTSTCRSHRRRGEAGRDRGLLGGSRPASRERRAAAGRRSTTRLVPQPGDLRARVRHVRRRSSDDLGRAARRGLHQAEDRPGVAARPVTSPTWRSRVSARERRGTDVRRGRAEPRTAARTGRCWESDGTLPRSNESESWEALGDRAATSAADSD